MGLGRYLYPKQIAIWASSFTKSRRKNHYILLKITLIPNRPHNYRNLSTSPVSFCRTTLPRRHCPKRFVGVLLSSSSGGVVDVTNSYADFLEKKPFIILVSLDLVLGESPEQRKLERLALGRNYEGRRKKGIVVLLQNLDPTYTSDEVEDIVYSALDEKCEARTIERTSVTIPHTGEALVIFKTRGAAERVIERLDEGCLLVSNGRPLVAVFAKITPPGKPSSFVGHIKLPKTQTRRELRDAVATSHSSQPNNLEFDMAMEWSLHQARYKQASETISKRQLEEKKSPRIHFKPKRP